MIPSVAELRHFLEVSRTLNLSQAAKNLYISQSSLSRSIQQFEQIVGTALFIRHKTGMTLTPAGKKMQSKIDPLVKNWQDTKIQVLASHQKIEGQVKIGCPAPIGLFMDDFIASILSVYPKIDIELCHHNSEVVTQKVIDMQIDIGIVNNPVEYPDLITRKICETDTTFWVKNDVGSTTTMHENNILIYHPKWPHSDNLLQKCKEINIEFNRSMKINSIDVIANLTAKGCGLGILPSCYVNKQYADKLKRVVNMPIVTNNIYLIYRKEYLNVQVIKTTIDCIKYWAEKNDGAPNVQGLLPKSSLAQDPII